MGLLFKKYAKNVYCPKCSNVANKGQFGVFHSGRYCPQCKADLVGFRSIFSYQGSVSGPFEYYYILRGTNIKIPENSKKHIGFIIIPSLLFGFLGLVPLFVFLIIATIDSILALAESFERDFLRIYDSFSGSNSILFRIFGNDWIVLSITFLSVYFGYRFFVRLFYELYYLYKNKKHNNTSK